MYICIYDIVRVHVFTYICYCVDVVGCSAASELALGYRPNYPSTTFQRVKQGPTSEVECQITSIHSHMWSLGLKLLNLHD